MTLSGRIRELRSRSGRKSDLATIRYEDEYRKEYLKQKLKYAKAEARRRARMDARKISQPHSGTAMKTFDRAARFSAGFLGGPQAVQRMEKLERRQKPTTKHRRRHKNDKADKKQQNQFTIVVRNPQ